MSKFLNWLGDLVNRIMYPGYYDIDYEESVGEEARPHWITNDEDEYTKAMLNSERFDG